MTKLIDAEIAELEIELEKKKEEKIQKEIEKDKERQKKRNIRRNKWIDKIRENMIDNLKKKCDIGRIVKGSFCPRCINVDIIESHKFENQEIVQISAGRPFIQLRIIDSECQCPLCGTVYTVI